MSGLSSPRSQPQPGHLYDVAVVGAGLAGTELAWRLAQAGRDVLLVSQALDTLGNLYQPSISGADFPAESIFALVRDQIAPETDGWTFHRWLKARIEATPGIHLLQSCVTELNEETSHAETDHEKTGSNAVIVTLSSWEGPELRARTVVLAVGAFLKGRLLLGEGLPGEGGLEEAGRLSEVAYDFLADDLSRCAVQLVGHAQHTPEVKGMPGYEVRFLTPAPAELDGPRLKRFDAVYALGRCTPGQHTYASVLQDAAALAAHLLRLEANA